MKTQADVVLAVRVPPALKRDLKRLAADDKRSLSNLVELLLGNALPAYLEKIKTQAAA